MRRFEEYLEQNQSFIFGFDQVIYPEKDYLLQVYYLFAQFIAYAEQIDEVALLEFIKKTYFEDGTGQVFEKTANAFQIPSKYQVNFELLLHNAKLPLKLLLFDEVFQFMQAIVLRKKQLFLLVDGDPSMQLNKIKQLDWRGLQSNLVVYFEVEIAAGDRSSSLNYLVEKHGLNPQETLFIGRTESVDAQLFNEGINYLSVAKLLNK